MQISDLATWVRALLEPSSAPLRTLDSFVALGLGEIALERSSSSLPGARHSA